MTYRIHGVSTSGGKLAEVERADYDRILLHRDTFLEFLYLEEKFDLLMENYFTFEEQVLTSSLRYLIFSGRVHDQIQEIRLSITRALINLLSTCRLYLDQSSHHLSNAFGKGSKHMSDHKAARSEEYDASLSYRILEALRNHAQHRGYPFHVVTFSSSLVEAQPGAPSVTRIIPKLSKKKLEEEGGFKRKVLDQLAELDEDQIDLRPHIRSYIDSIQRIHSKLRENFEPEVANSISALNSACMLFRANDEEFDQSSIWMLRFLGDQSSGEDVDGHFVFKSIERLEEFHQKNPASATLSSSFVSSQIQTPSA